VGIKDFYGLLQRDTTEVSGSLAADLELGGTRESPTITGTVQMADATLQDFRGPLGRAIVHYQDRILEANLLLWRTGQTVLRVEASLPMDLGLHPVEDRRLPGPLRVRAVADSVDLGVLDAFSESVQQVRGNLFADVQIEGTWEDPRLTGTLGLTNARARVPGLGVGFRDIRGRAHMVGDTVVIDTLRIDGETGGSVDIAGWVRMENLTEPVLNLAASANNFLVIDVRDYLTLAASGDVRLTGPFWNPVLTGGITANRGVLYFADLVNKQVVDLEDPANADLVDLEVIRERRLGADFQNRFLDSLRIENLDLRVRDNFWLRSSEANIGLEGQLRVNKVRREYRLDGELRALRGNYALRLGNLVTRNFTVLRGDVKYFGTPDLDAQIDIEAEHRVTPVDRGEQIPIIAHITGTLQAPQLELHNTNGPPIPESDLVSYLVLGRPGPGFGGVGTGGQESGALAFGTSALFSTLTSEVERALISDVGLPIDYVAIRPGSGSLLGSSNSATRIAAGWRLTRAVFITLSAGFCPNDQLLNYKALGASLEWRFGLRWRSSISVEPVGNCGISNQPDVLQSTRYQIGVDLLWEKEY